MKKEEILKEVATSSWQPQFQFTSDLNDVVDSILKPHEDYFLGLHGKVKEIIQREIEHAITLDAYKITFADVCNWQKELFEEKIFHIEEFKKRECGDKWHNYGSPESFYLDKARALELPNLHINLGLRQNNVKVGKWNPPHPIFLEDLKSMCFPITIVENNLFIEEGWKEGYYPSLTEWYKIFETIHFFEDLNGRLGGIVINILSFLTTGKYLKTNQTV